MNLTDREWREFKISNLFLIKKVLGLPIENYSSGNIPYITTASTNNGFTNFISAPENAISKKCCISIDPIKGKAFYHPYKFVGRGFSGASINLLYNEKMNKNIAIFLCRTIENTAKYKASYGYLFNGNRLENGKILLPVDKKNNPDYKFMEDYIKEKMLQRRQEYIEYAKNKLKQIKFENISSLKDKKWKEFFIEDIFFIKSGKRLVKEQMIFGDIPFIGASTLNNGITNYISQKNCSFDSNVLGVNYNGSVGEAFYHPYGCIFSDDVKRFHMLNYNDNKFLLLFLATIIKQQKEKFNYGYKFNETRMLRQKILLPVNNNDEPDYIYMEKYIKNIFYKKYSDYLEYIKIFLS